MNQFTSELERIRSDVGHAGHMGLRTTIRLLNLLEQMTQEIDRLSRRAGTEK
jgi:hypothetical protein